VVILKRCGICHITIEGIGTKRLFLRGETEKKTGGTPNEERDLYEFRIKRSSVVLCPGPIITNAGKMHRSSSLAMRPRLSIYSSGHRCYRLV